MIISTYILEKLPFIDANNIKINPELLNFLQFFASHSCSLLPKIMVKINIISTRWSFSTYWSCVEMQSLEYLSSALYLMLKHFLPEISNLLTLRNSSVLLPANMGPMISSILPLCGSWLSFFRYLWSMARGSAFSEAFLLMLSCSENLLLRGLEGPEYYSLFEQV